MYSRRKFLGVIAAPAAGATVVALHPWGCGGPWLLWPSMWVLRTRQQLKRLSGSKCRRPLRWTAR